MTIGNKAVFTFALFLACFGVSSNAAIALPGAMQTLCKKAETDAFKPLPASLRSPNPDSLFQAIERGAKGTLVKRLLDGRHPDSIVSQDMTPMQFAALTGNWPAAQALLDAGADVGHMHKSKFDGSSTTPLDIALITNQFAFACKLIEFGAKLPEKQEDKNNLFSAALVMEPKAFSRGAIFVDFLLQQGFDVNEFGSSLETPLMGSVALNNVPTIKVLLKHGARLDIVKSGDRTVWGVAYEKNNPQVLKLLEEAQKKATVEIEKAAE